MPPTTPVPAKNLRGQALSSELISTGFPGFEVAVSDGEHEEQHPDQQPHRPFECPDSRPNSFGLLFQCVGKLFRLRIEGGGIDFQYGRFDILEHPAVHCRRSFGLLPDFLQPVDLADQVIG